MALYDDVIAQGIEHVNHESDLYLPVTVETTALVNKYYRQTQLRYRFRLSTILEEQKMTISVIINVLTDGSKSFDILLQDDGGGSVTIPLDALHLTRARRKASQLHTTLEAVTT